MYSNVFCLYDNPTALIMIGVCKRCHSLCFIAPQHSVMTYLQSCSALGSLERLGWHLLLQELGDVELGCNILVYLWPRLQVGLPTVLIQSKLKPPELKQDEDIGSPPTCWLALIPDPWPTVQAYDCHPVMILCRTFCSAMQPTQVQKCDLWCGLKGNAIS